jgi:hypothetical protein
LEKRLFEALLETERRFETASEPRLFVAALEKRRFEAALEKRLFEAVLETERRFETTSDRRPFVAVLEKRRYETAFEPRQQLLVGLAKNNKRLILRVLTILHYSGKICLFR